MRHQVLGLVIMLFISNGILAQCGPLSTPSLTNNGQDGIMFDIVALTPVTIDQFSMDFDTGTHTIEIYTIPNTHVGNETNAAAWTLIGSVSGWNSTTGTNVVIPIPIGVFLCNGESAGFYISSTTGGCNYSNGTGVGNVAAADANIQILEGTGKDYPFNTSFTPRVPNVTVEYTCQPSCCTVPNLITDNLTACAPNSVDLNNGINPASDPGNPSFYNTSGDANAGTNAISNIVTTSGTYYVRYEKPSDPNCFVVGTIVVTINPNYAITEDFDVCQGSDYTYPDGTTSTNIQANESHISNLTTTLGCDSTVTTNLTMTPASSTTENVSVCTGGDYTYPDGTTSTNITVNETHVSNLTTPAGCDSIVTTNVSVITAFNTNESASVCPGGSYTYPDGVTSTNIMANESHVSNLTSVQGCDSIVTTDITLYPTYNETENVTACEGSSYTYPDGFTEVISANTSHVSNLTTVQGCDSIITTNVTMDPLPYAGTDGSITLCSTDPSTDLFNEIGGSPASGGTWSPAMASGTGVFDPAVDASGVYTYQVSNSCGTDDATVTVTVDQLQDATFGYSSNSYCSNDLNPAAVISGVTGGTFTINNGGVIDPATGEININASGVGNYTITYTTPGPCQNSSTVSVSISQQADASITQVGPFCDYDGSVILQTVQSGGTWSGPGVDPVTGEFDPAQANIGTNTITYTIGGPCGDSQSIDIEVFPTPTVNTIANTEIDLGNSIVLNTTSNASNYSWSPDIWLSCSDCLSPTATPEDNVTYEITVEENGCYATDFVSIIVLYDPIIFVPNIFSPNGDNNNDVLFVRGIGVDYITFYVYDRWGEKVFESTSLEDGWDGTFRGKPMNPGVFVYYVEATFLNGTTSTLKGDVTLIR